MARQNDAWSPLAELLLTATDTFARHHDGLIPSEVIMKSWIAVASAEHEHRGRDDPLGGNMQVCHGKLGSLRRVSPGDRVAYYAPTQPIRRADRYQRFVSNGMVEPGEPCAYDMDDHDMRLIADAMAADTALLEFV